MPKQPTPVNFVRKRKKGASTRLITLQRTLQALPAGQRPAIVEKHFLARIALAKTILTVEERNHARELLTRLQQKKPSSKFIPLIQAKLTGRV